VGDSVGEADGVAVGASVHVRQCAGQMALIVASVQPLPSRIIAPQVDGSGP
jgi:hypothetical protein